MNLEERRYGSSMGNNHVPQFVTAIRVLAVDDDPMCLKMLEGLLHRCKYNVTTTNHAMKALNILREKKGEFDLVISDVHMPDMDGFKLLEQVGLEMDLPVVMLSANSDPNSVMKGINHGACDYLLKPVRIEELQNIWIHVLRKRNKESSPNNCDNFEEDNNNYTNVNSSKDGSTGVVIGPSARGSDNKGLSNPNKKREKDHHEEDDFGSVDYIDQNGSYRYESKDKSTAKKNKKTRLAWSPELHKKFVSAISQLGLHRQAMPKKILELMNVDKLTREHVASHLQKYKIYLRKQENNFPNALSAARGAASTSNLQMDHLDFDTRNYHGFSAEAATGHHVPAAVQLAPFHHQAAALGRTNRMSCPPGSTADAYGLGSSGSAGGGMIQLGPGDTIGHYQDLGRHINFGGTPRPNLLQGIPSSLESNQLLNQRILLQANNMSSSSGFPDGDVAFRDMGSSFNLATSNKMLLSSNRRHQQLTNGLGTQISAELPTMSVHPFEIDTGASSSSSSNLPGLNSCSNAAWQGPAASLTAGYPENMLPISPCDLGETFSAVNLDSNMNIVHPSNYMTSSFQDSMINESIQLEGNNIMHASVSGESSFLHAYNTGNLGSGWNEQRSTQPVGMFQSPSGSAVSNISNIPNVSQAFNHGFFHVNSKGLPRVNDQSRFAIADLPYPQNMRQQGFASPNQLESRDDEYPVLIETYDLAHMNMFDELMNATYLLPDNNDGGLTDGDIGSVMH